MKRSWKWIAVCAMILAVTVFAIGTAGAEGERRLRTKMPVLADYTPRRGGAQIQGPQTGVTGEEYNFTINNGTDEGVVAYEFVVAIDDEPGANADTLYSSIRTTASSFTYTFYEPGNYCLYVYRYDAAGDPVMWQSGMQQYEFVYGTITVTQGEGGNALTAAVARAADECDQDDEFLTAVAINDYLCDHVTYDYSYTYYSPEAALLNGTGVCNSYSRAYKLIADACGLECMRVTGKAGKDGHAWNAVKIDGKWYQVDPTWNDGSGAGFRHIYMGLTDELMSLGHSIFHYPNSTAVTCDSLDRNYFVHTGKWRDLVSSAANGGSSVMDQLQDAVNAGETTITADFGNRAWLEGGNRYTTSTSILRINGTVAAYALSRETLYNTEDEMETPVRGTFTYNATARTLSGEMEASGLEISGLYDTYSTGDLFSNTAVIYSAATAEELEGVSLYVEIVRKEDGSEQCSGWTEYDRESGSAMTFVPDGWQIWENGNYLFRACVRDTTGAIITQGQQEFTVSCPEMAPLTSTLPAFFLPGDQTISLFSPQESTTMNVWIVAVDAEWNERLLYGTPETTKDVPDKAIPISASAGEQIYIYGYADKAGYNRQYFDYILPVIERVSDADHPVTVTLDREGSGVLINAGGTATVSAPGANWVSFSDNQGNNSEAFQEASHSFGYYVNEGQGTYTILGSAGFPDGNGGETVYTCVQTYPVIRTGVIGPFSITGSNLPDTEPFIERGDILEVTLSEATGPEDVDYNIILTHLPDDWPDAEWYWKDRENRIAAIRTINLPAGGYSLRFDAAAPGCTTRSSTDSYNGELQFTIRETDMGANGGFLFRVSDTEVLTGQEVGYTAYAGGSYKIALYYDYKPYGSTDYVHTEDSWYNGQTRYWYSGTYTMLARAWYRGNPGAGAVQSEDFIYNEATKDYELSTAWYRDEARTVTVQAAEGQVLAITDGVVTWEAGEDSLTVAVQWPQNAEHVRITVQDAAARWAYFTSREFEPGDRDTETGTVTLSLTPADIANMQAGHALRIEVSAMAAGYEGATWATEIAAIKECTHEKRTEQGPFDITYTDVPGDNKNHRKTGTMAQFLVCDICGTVDLIEGTEYEVNDMAEPHHYEDGTCVLCGHVNTCTHANISTYEWFKDWDANEYTSLDNLRHKISGEGVRSTECTDCNTLFTYEDTELTVTEHHRYAFDPATGTYTCSGCGHVCTHTFNADGFCEACGFTCAHEGLQNAAEQTRNTEKAEEISDTEHRVYACTETYKVCPDCGKEIISNQVTGALLRTEAHDYSQADGQCAACGYWCGHPGWEDQEEILIPVTGSYTGKIDAATHGTGPCAEVRKECPVCHQQVLMEYRLTGEADEGSVTAHNFDENGYCPDCQYSCPHNWTEGVCSMCGITCGHDNGWRREETWSADTVFTPEDDWSHHVTGTRIERSICDRCGSIIEENETAVDNSYNHTWIGKISGTEEAAACADCGAANTCAHESHRSYPSWDTVEYTVIDAATHRAEGIADLVNECDRCGVYMAEPIHYDAYETTETHNFDPNGVCWQCGYACPHSHTRQAASPDYSTAATYTAEDNYSHTETRNGTIAVMCDDCYAELSRQENVPISETTSHLYYYDEATETEVCQYCGHVCTHDFDENGVCRACGLGCSHSWENGVCTICGRTCIHEYDSSNGTCSICGTHCSHEGSTTITDGESETYEWVSTATHRRRMTVTSHLYCPVCHYNGEQTTTEGPETIENHTDTNIDGICDVCGYSIQESSDWTVDGTTLIITGQGDLPDYTGGDATPWAIYRDTVNRIVIEENVTGIGDYALAGFTAPGLRIEFRQRIQPAISATAFTGTAGAVCRYYAETGWTGGNYGGENIRWIYLPYFDEEDWTVDLYYKTDGWYISPRTAGGSTDMKVTAAQALEYTHTRRDLHFDVIPEETDEVISNWDAVTMLYFSQGFIGEMEITLGENSALADLDMYAPEAVVTIHDPRENGISGRIVMNAGTLNYDGNVGELLAEASYDNTGHVTVSGSVRNLNLYDATSDRAYKGDLTIHGTIATGTIYGEKTMAIQGVSDSVSFGGMVKYTFANIQQDQAIVLNSELNLTAQNQALLVSTGEPTQDQFAYGYQFLESRVFFTVSAKDPNMPQYSAYIENIYDLNPNFTESDIIYGSDTTVYVGLQNNTSLTFNGTTQNGNRTGLRSISMEPACDVTVNCPVEWLEVTHYPWSTGAIRLTINDRVDFCWLRISNGPGTVVTLGENGHVVSGQWSRSLARIRLFSGVHGAGDLFRNGQLAVLSANDGQRLKALLPSDSTVTAAAGQDATMELTEVTAEALSTQEAQALDSYLANQGSGAVASLFDVSVTGVTVNMAAQTMEAGESITELGTPLELTVSNEAKDEAYVLRLHGNGDGSVSAEAVSSASDADTLSFSSALFSKYAVIAVNGTQPESEIEWRIADSRLILTGQGPMADYDSPADTPWYSQRDEIREIILDAGITKIGANAFGGFSSTVRVDFNQNAMPDAAENAFSGSNVICRYYTEGDSWTGAYGAESIRWVYLPVNNQGSNYENIHYYKDHSYWGTGWVFSKGYEMKVTREQAEELSFMGRAITLHAIPEEQADRDMFEAHMDVVNNLYFYPQGSGTYTLMVPAETHNCCIDFDAPGWTLNVNAQGASENAFAMVFMGGGTMNVTAPKVSNLFIGTYSNGGTPATGNLTVNADVDVLNFYNSTNPDRNFAGNATINGTITQGYEYGTATAVIPNIPNITASQVIVSQFANVNQAEPVVLDSRLNVAGVATYDTYTVNNCRLDYSLYSNNGEDWWRLQISPKTGDNAQPVHIEIADYNPDFTMDDIYWGPDTGLGLVRARPGQTVEINGGNGTGAGSITIMETSAVINCPVSDLTLEDWSRDGNSFQVTLNNAAEYCWLKPNYKNCSLALGQNGSITHGSLQRPLYDTLFFDNARGACTVLQNSELRILSRRAGQTIPTILPAEDTLTAAAGLGNGQIAIMEVTDAAALTETEEAAIAAAQIQGTAGAALDISVTAYDVNPEENTGTPAGSVTVLNSAVPIVIENTTGEEAFIVRLHEEAGAGGTTTVTATQMTQPSDAAVFTVNTDRFSKYVLVTTGQGFDPAALDTLTLPAFLTRIEEEAFTGGTFEAVIIPDSCTYIGPRAFADCDRLVYISYPAGCQIDGSAFDNWDDLRKDERTPSVGR